MKCSLCTASRMRQKWPAASVTRVVDLRQEDQAPASGRPMRLRQINIVGLAFLTDGRGQGGHRHQ